MFNNEHLNELRRAVRFEQLNASSRCFPTQFVGHPPPNNRTQITPSRLPSPCFRSFQRPVLRPNQPISHTNIMHSQNRMEYQTFMSGAKQKSAERPMFSQPPVNLVQNDGTQTHFPSQHAMANSLENQINPALSTQNTFSHDLKISDDLWIETKSPDGRKYYYNAKSRDSKWEKPENVRIMTLQQIKLIASHQNGKQTQDSPNMSRPVLPLNPPPYFGHYVNRNLSIPGNTRIMMFPPPTLCAPPPMFPAVLPFRETLNCNLNVNSIPYVIPPNLATDNSTLNATASTFVCTNLSGNFKRTQQELIADNNKNKEFVNQATEAINDTDNKIEPISVSEKSSDIVRSTEATATNDVRRTDSTVSDALEPVTGSSMDVDKTVSNEFSHPVESEMMSSMDIDKAVSDHFHNIGKETSEQLDRNLGIDKNDNISSNQEFIAKKQKSHEVDKSRPISSTPIPGSTWCVVWTGDNRVFFYDSSRKLSVWNQPEELKARPEVQKLIEYPPVAPLVKQENGTCSPGVKKLKVEDNGQTSDTSLATNQHIEDDAVEKETEMKSEHETPNDVQAKLPYEERVKIFRQILVDNNVSAFSSWEKELHKIVFDPRYLLIPSKERKKIFEMYVKERLEEDKDKKSKETRYSREKYNQLLLEAGVTSTMRFSDFAERYNKDERFRAIAKIKEKERLFKEFISDLRKKEKEHKAHNEQQKERFFQLLNEQKCLNKNSIWSEIEQNISNDDRYREISDNSLREKLFREYIRKLYLGTVSSDIKEKEERQNSSIRIREEEVKKDLSVHMKERDRERELHKHDLAVNGFKALLTDLIRNADITWHEARRLMKKDHRWEVVYCLSSEEREKMFDEHIGHLLFKKKHQFRQILDEIPEITLKSSWHDVRQIVLNDSRCSKFSSKEKKCEKEFRDYMKDKLIAAKTDFKDLLKETKLITYKSKELLKGTNHLQSIEKILENDKRYLVLDSFKSERKEMLLSYIDKLHSKGPPPPPTATDPSKHGN